MRRFTPLTKIADPNNSGNENEHKGSSLLIFAIDTKDNYKYSPKGNEIHKIQSLNDANEALNRKSTNNEKKMVLNYVDSNGYQPNKLYKKYSIL